MQPGRQAGVVSTREGVVGELLLAAAYCWGSQAWWAAQGSVSCLSGVGKQCVVSVVGSSRRGSATH